MMSKILDTCVFQCDPMSTGRRNDRAMVSYRERRGRNVVEQDDTDTVSGEVSGPVRHLSLGRLKKEKKGYEYPGESGGTTYQ
jgi:hypothetical protein